MARLPKKASPKDSVFSLPAYRIGPYEMCVVAAQRSDFHDQRRKVENDWTAGKVHIDSASTPMQAITYFMRHMITAIHYRSGLNDKSDEESFTHSLSTGLVEIARTNPYFWETFNSVLEDTIRPKSGWVEAAGGMDPDAALKRPKIISYKNRGCQLTDIDNATCNRKGVYGYYTLGTGPIELSDGLKGANLAIVALHEVIHFLHECEGMKDKTSEKVFKQTQVKMLLTFWKTNPTFWKWWLSTVNPHNAESVHDNLRQSYRN